MIYLITLIAIILIGLTMEDRSNRDMVATWPTIWVVIWAAILWFFYRDPVIGVWNNGIPWVTVAIAVAIYIVVGLIWSFFKWIQYVKYCYNLWVRAGKSEDDGPYRRKENFIPQASEKKAKISAWILFWPFSCISFILGDMWDNLLIYFGSVYEKIAVDQFNR